MSRSSFFARTSISQSQNLSLDQDRKLDSSPLLPLHENPDAVSLRDLSPRSSHSYSRERRSSGRASPSPSPSFYRDALNSKASSSIGGTGEGGAGARKSGGGGGRGDGDEQTESYPQTMSSLSPSPSRTKDSGRRRRIMFDAPPPPIATSMLLSPLHTSPQGGHRASSRDSGSRQPIARQGVDPLIVLERRERAIQRDLQCLLDAQSAGLIHGFGGGAGVGGEVGGEGASDTGSNTPTSRSFATGSRSASGNRGITPVRQPKSKPIGLRGARRGILRGMGELVNIKDEETNILSSEIEKREFLLRKIATWEVRISGVQGKLEAAATRKSDVRSERDIEDLRSEERAVEAEIRDLEERLAAMRAKQRWLADRIKEGVNRREAKMSSYRGALREAELEVAEFLRRPPIDAASVIMRGDDEGFFVALPPARRTLGLARDWWTRELAVLTERRDETAKERQVLEEGAALWDESVNAVVGFEDGLRAEMGRAGGGGDLKGQIDRMREVIQGLEEVRDGAAARGWNLLVCAVGAEAEAFKQGRSILMGALGMSDDESEANRENNRGLGGHGDHPEYPEKEKDKENENENGIDALDDLDPRRLQRQISSEREESESDDGPNLAELLVERTGDDDTS